MDVRGAEKGLTTTGGPSDPTSKTHRLDGLEY